MKLTLALLALLAICATAQAHGGGCRKNSPPGPCGHLANSTGTVHCH